MGSHGVQHFMDTSNFNDGHEHDDFALEKIFKIMIWDNTKSQNINVNANLRYLVDKVF